MANVRRQTIYESVKRGKRVVVIDSRDLLPVRVWLWKNGYTYKANRNGEFLELMIDKR